LTPYGAELFACEPVEGMRATFRSMLPTVPIVAATAESLPLRDASVDAMTVAQAWHWFDHERAAAEAARVIRPGGALALVWNARDRSFPWVDALWSIMDRVEKRAPWRDHENWRDSAVREMPGFGPMETAEFHHRQPITPEGVIRRMASVSHVAVLPEPERTAVLDEVRDILRSHPEVAGREQLELPYRTDCLLFRRG
jgi:SAM-dependent methyltransferase